MFLILKNGVYGIFSISFIAFAVMLFCNILVSPTERYIQEGGHGASATELSPRSIVQVIPEICVVRFIPQYIVLLYDCLIPLLHFSIILVNVFFMSFMFFLWSCYTFDSSWSILCNPVVQCVFLCVLRTQQGVRHFLCIYIYIYLWYMYIYIYIYAVFTSSHKIVYVCI